MKNIDERAEKIRGFNRFYTGLFDLLNNRLLESDFSLTESRIIFELGARENMSAVDLANMLGLDSGYLSRILKKLVKKGLINRKKSKEDSRKQIIFLTETGRNILADLIAKSNNQVKGLLHGLSEENQGRLINAMETIAGIFKKEDNHLEPIILRSHKPGDIGYIIHRHGVLYSEEYGFDETFDAYVAVGMAKFLENFDPTKEYLWIAEMDSKIGGSIAITKMDDNIAQLRWLILEPRMRGKGLGKKLVDEAIQFCKRKGYSKIILWTVSQLKAARNLYEKVGFELYETKTHHIWGHEITEERWELEFQQQ